MTDTGRDNQQAFPQEPQQKPGRGTLILALGIFSIVVSLCGCYYTSVLSPAPGIPAWLMGRNDLKEIEQGRIPPGARSVTKAGMICGIVGTFLGPVLQLVLLAVGVQMLSSGR